MQLWCGICDIPCPTISKLHDHNNSKRHENNLRKYNMFPPKEAEEFAIYYVSQPKSQVVQEGNILNHLFCFIPYCFKFLYISQIPLLTIV